MTNELGGYLAGDVENPEFIRLNLPARTPEHAPTDEPTICYRINSDYIGYVLAGIDPFSHSDAFVGTQEEREQAAAWFVELQILLMTGNVSCGEVDGMQLRQNPSNPCQLEQSFDNGASWSLAFDYSLCFRESKGTNITIVNNNMAEAVAFANAIAETWGGTWQELAPGMDYDLSITDEQRDNAYCYALQLFLNQVGLILGEMEASGWSGWDIAEIVAWIVASGAPMVIGWAAYAGKTLHPAVLLATTIAEVVAIVAIDWLGGHEEAPEISDFLSAATQESLICCGMDVVGGMTPSALRFAQMFDVCDDVTLDGLSQAAVIALLDSERMYTVYLTVVQAAFEALERGQIFNCPCAVETITFELTTESGVEPDTYYGEQTWENSPDDAGCYLYVPEGGVFFGDETTGQYINYRGVSMRIPGVFGEVRSVEVQGNNALGTGSPSDDCVAIAYGGDLKQWSRATASIGIDATNKRTAYRELNDDTIVIYWRSDVRYGYSDPLIGSCMVARVIIRGKDLSITGVT